MKPLPRYFFLIVIITLFTNSTMVGIILSPDLAFPSLNIENREDDKISIPLGRWTIEALETYEDTTYILMRGYDDEIRDEYNDPKQIINFAGIDHSGEILFNVSLDINTTETNPTITDINSAGVFIADTSPYRPGYNASNMPELRAEILQYSFTGKHIQTLVLYPELELQTDKNFTSFWFDMISETSHTYFVFQLNEYFPTHPIDRRTRTIQLYELSTTDSKMHLLKQFSNERNSSSDEYSSISVHMRSTMNKVLFSIIQYKINGETIITLYELKNGEMKGERTYFMDDGSNYPRIQLVDKDTIFAIYFDRNEDYKQIVFQELNHELTEKYPVEADIIGFRDIEVDQKTMIVHYSQYAGGEEGNSHSLLLVSRYRNQIIMKDYSLTGEMTENTAIDSISIGDDVMILIINSYDQSGIRSSIVIYPNVISSGLLLEDIHPILQFNVVGILLFIHLIYLTVKRRLQRELPKDLAFPKIDD